MWAAGFQLSGSGALIVRRHEASHSIGDRDAQVRIRPVRFALDR